MGCEIFDCVVFLLETMVDRGFEPGNPYTSAQHIFEPLDQKSD